MMGLAYITVFVGNIWAFLSHTPKHLVNKSLKLNPFAVKMLVIHRYFNIENARRDLKYEPVITFEDGWTQTTNWFKENWLPDFNAKKNK